MSNYSDDDNYVPPPKAPREEPFWYKTHKDEYGNQITTDTAKKYINEWREYFANDKTLGNFSDDEIISIITSKVGGKRRTKMSRKSRKTRKSRKNRRSRRFRR